MFKAERLRMDRKRVGSRRRGSTGGRQRGRRPSDSCRSRKGCGRIDRDGLTRRAEDVGVRLEVGERWRVDMGRSDRTLCRLHPMHSRFRVVCRGDARKSRLDNLEQRTKDTHSQVSASDGSHGNLVRPPRARRTVTVADRENSLLPRSCACLRHESVAAARIGSEWPGRGAEGTASTPTRLRTLAKSRE